MAQPVSFAHHLLAYVEMFARDNERMADVRRRTNRRRWAAQPWLAPPTRWTATVARILGHGGTRNGQPRFARNSLDAVSDRDFAIEFTAAASLCMIHISRLSEELIVMSQNFGFIKLPTASPPAAAIMPQRKPRRARTGTGQNRPRGGDT